MNSKLVRIERLQQNRDDITVHSIELSFLDPAPPPTDEICNVFNELRSDMVLLCELRTALADCKFELESLKHQFEAVCPGKVSTSSN